MPQGVAPPAQLRVVPVRMRAASRTVPSAAKWIAEAPPPGPSTSEFETRIQPPSDPTKVAAPSEAECHT